MRKIGAWNQESEIRSVIQTHEAQKDPGHTTTQQESAAFQATNIPLPFIYFLVSLPLTLVRFHFYVHAKHNTHHPIGNNDHQDLPPNQCRPNDIKPKSDGVKQVHLNHGISGVGMRCINYLNNKESCDWEKDKQMIYTGIQHWKLWWKLSWYPKKKWVRPKKHLPL